MNKNEAAVNIPAVSVHGVSKHFGDTTALDDISLEIRRGEFFSLLGPSGCGKTTLLRIIGGFEEPDGGEILIGGQDVASEPPYRRRTNMILQHLALFPHLSVSENIAFGLEMKKMAKGAIDNKVANILRLVRLDGYGRRKIDEISGGQKQRVAIARALVNEPEVLLLDEPLGALDLQLRLQMHDELKRIHRAIGSTFILVTHDQTEAITLSDRIGVMNQGRIVQVGAPAEIYNHPTNRFVANFIGHANFIPGKVVSISGEEINISVDGLTFAGRGAKSMRAGEEAIGVLRYEHLMILPSDSQNGFPAVVEEVAFHGSTYRVSLLLEGRIKLISELASGGSTPQPKVGNSVRADWNRNNLTFLVE